MLAFINGSVCGGPEELRSPTSRKDRWKTGAEIMDSFVSSVPDAVCLKVEPDGAMAYTHRNQNPLKPRYLACVDDIVCIFVGCLDNLAVLRRQYGLAMNAKEDMVVIEAYRALRDRSPYPADQVLKEFSGGFAFVLLDCSTHTIFAAADKDGRVMLHWGTAADGALVFSDDPDLLQDGCDKSFAPFPAGCMFWNGGGLQSFEHPLYKMQAVARLDSEGQMCGATFRVDKMSRVNSIPRVGSASNWSNLYSFAH
uniref:TSA: Wollemia nobilis Ref_Wollemi_Transcript_13466_1457 transcribed RNA sequence n=1 Tax=Wollemia nobilis TaxID=56998 RepID=A0A0C9QQZ0_9CONI